MKAENKIRTVAITGSVSSGKSYVCGIIKKLGFPFISSDEINTKMMNSYYFLRNLKSINQNIFNKDGKINKVALFKEIFNDNGVINNLKLLNFIQKNILIRRQRLFKINIGKFKNKKFVFFEIPLLFELKLQYEFDHNVLIYCTSDVRRERFVEKKQLLNQKYKDSPDFDYDFEISKFDIFDKNQIPNFIKKKKSDFVIYNSYNKDIFTYIQIFRMFLQFYFINFFKKWPKKESYR